MFRLILLLVWLVSIVGFAQPVNEANYPLKTDSLYLMLNVKVEPQLVNQSLSDQLYDLWASLRKGTDDERPDRLYKYSYKLQNLSHVGTAEVSFNGKGFDNTIFGKAIGPNKVWLSPGSHLRVIVISNQPPQETEVMVWFEAISEPRDRSGFELPLLNATDASSFPLVLDSSIQP
jgi:hypothetical protein